jgi:hypothetical protein
MISTHRRRLTDDGRRGPSDAVRWRANECLVRLASNGRRSAPQIDAPRWVTEQRDVATLDPHPHDPGTGPADRWRRERLHDLLGACREAAARVERYRRASSLVVTVDRRMSSLETDARLAGRSFVSRAASPTAFSLLQRICCSSLRSSDWTSEAMITGLARSVSTRSITPRDGCVIGTSSAGDHRGSRARISASTIGAWNRSWSRGPEPG